MKNDTTALKVLLYTAGGAAALAGMCAYLVAPGKRDKARRAPSWAAITHIAACTG